MSILNGCQEGKATPKLVEVLCPKCGAEMEIFVRRGGSAGVTGTLAEEARCDGCGHVFPAGEGAGDFRTI